MSASKIQSLDPGVLAQLQAQAQAVIDAKARRDAAEGAHTAASVAFNAAVDEFVQAQQLLDSAIVSACGAPQVFAFGGFVLTPGNQPGCYLVAPMPPELASLPGGA